jgi:ectoine hydroxylase-related dioxygenase (phytanoyl-CoA dioxygenase family)
MNSESLLSPEHLDIVERDLREVGFHIIENVITPEAADEARAAVLRLVEDDIANGRDHSYGEGKIRRVWALVSKGPVFRRLIQNPTVAAVWRRMLGQDFVASTFTANIVGPSAPAGGWHIDYPYWAMEPPFPEGSLTGQTVWMLDEFTPDNGPTACIPGSHKTLRRPKPGEAESMEKCVAVAPRGSILFTNGAIWHQCIPNTTDKARVGLLGMYNRAVIYPQEDMPRQLTDAELEGESDLLKQLLGRNIPFRDPNHGVNWRRTEGGFEVLE